MKILNIFTKQKYFILSLLITLWAGFALFHPGLPPTHDGEYHVIRFYEFDKVLREGNWYPRWAPDLNFGYGVPLFTYVYPLPNFVASLLHTFGTSFIDSFKLGMLAATLIGGIFFYLFAKEYWGEKGGLVASAFYSFSPYHFVDIYVRGSVGEVWALGLFPVWLWSYTKFVRTKNVSYYLCSTISLALIIFSHNILALMFFCFILCYITFIFFQSQKKKFVLLSSISIAALGLGLSSIFWLPALLQTNYVDGLQIFNLQKNFPDLFQLLFPSWGTGFFDNNLTNQMSVQIGIANLFAICVIFISLLRRSKEKNPHKSFTLFFFCAYIITFFLLTPFSFAIWQWTPLLHYFQFPWRLLSLMILISSFLAGSFFYKKRSFVWIALYLGILFMTTYDYAHPAFYHMRDDRYYVTRSNFIDGTNSPGNAFHTRWTSVFSEKAKQQAIIIKGEGTIVLTGSHATKKIFVANMISPSEVVFSLGFYPSWIVTENTHIIPIHNNNGLVSVMLPKGKSIVSVRFSNTFIENLALGISIFSFLVLIASCFIHLSFVRKSSKNL